MTAPVLTAISKLDEDEVPKRIELKGLLLFLFKNGALIITEKDGDLHHPDSVFISPDEFDTITAARADHLA